MVRSEKPGSAGSDQSLGDLVALAAKDVSRLVRYEIELAKTELRADLQRIGLAGALGGFSFYFGCLVLLLLCFAYAYGLIAAGIWEWAAFLIAAGTVLLLAALVAGIAYLKVRKLSGLSLTKKTVNEDLDMLRREGLLPEASPDGERPEIATGHRPEIPARKPQ
jgi:uncharacterized membrane protein YqjE